MVMAEPYLKEIQSIVDRFAANGDVACKHFFSGAAAYVNGQIFMTLTPVGLALKLPETDHNSLLKAGGKPVRYFPKAPVKKEYLLVPKTLIDNERSLAVWIAKGVAFARTGDDVVRSPRRR